MIIKVMASNPTFSHARFSLDGGFDASGDRPGLCSAPPCSMPGSLAASRGLDRDGSQLLPPVDGNRSDASIAVRCSTAQVAGAYKDEFTIVIELFFASASPRPSNV